MTGAELLQYVMQVGGFLIVVAGFGLGIWRYVESKITGVKQDASMAASAAHATASTAREELQSHKLHVAENYLTKAGLREAVEPIMDAIQGVKGAVDHLGGRIDGMYHAGTTPRPRTANK